MGQSVDYKFCPQCKAPMTKLKGNPHCDKCDITIYNNVAGGAAVAIVQDRKVLVTRRAIEPHKGSFDLIGGFIVPGETPRQAAVREAKEETGLDVRIDGLLGIYSDQYGQGVHTLGIHYVGSIVGGEMRPGDDAASLEWLDLNSLPQAALEGGFKNMRESLKDLRDKYASG